MKPRTRRTFMKECTATGAVVGPALLLSTGCGESSGGTPDDDGKGSPLEPESEKPDAAESSEPSNPSEPVYLALHRNGELKKRGEALWNRMSPCKLCPRSCGVDRLAGEKGFCQAGDTLAIASHNPHFGEERPLVGRHGSGTIFFSHCGLRCVFCINHEINIDGRGKTRTLDDLATMMLELQTIGCHNINVVTPSHYSPYIVLALDRAAARGLCLPLVYNTCGWEQIEILRLLDGVVDIYLPDFKYASGDMAATYSTCLPIDTRFLESEAGARYSTTDIYPDLTKMALLEMHRQVGVARPGADGLVRRGLMIRHLVMPNDVSGSREVVGWIADHLPKDTYVNLMSQYTPMHRAAEFPDINRRITRDEYRVVVEAAREAGLTNLEIQGSRWM